MSKTIDIAVENKLITEKRDINVFHLSTRSAHIISHNSSVTLPLRSDGEGDYLQVSAARGPGNLLKNCMVSLPSWVDFEFSSEGDLVLTHSNGNNRTLLKIPPGLPSWELKITAPTNVSTIDPYTSSGDNITIGDKGV